MYHPRHKFSRRAPPCDHPRLHDHGTPHRDEYLDIIYMLQGCDINNVAELEYVLDGAYMGDEMCIDLQTELVRRGYTGRVLIHYHLLSPAWVHDDKLRKGFPMDGGSYGEGVYIPSGAPSQHHHGPPRDGGRYGEGVYIPRGAPGHHGPGPRPTRGRDGRGVPYVEDTGSEASVFAGFRDAQARRGNQGRRGGRRRIEQDDEDEYETSPPPRRGGGRRHDEDEVEVEVEGSESEASAPPPRRTGGRTRRDPSPEVSERRERVGARNRRDEDEGSDESPPPPPKRSGGRRTGDDAKVEERRARVEHTGQTNMHWKPGALKFEDIQELESDEDGEEAEKPVKAKKKGGKSGGGAKEAKGQPRDRY